jgi:uroporphyrinogen-III synthase
MSATPTATLTGRRIVIPESRELDLFATMLEERGAATLRCPLVAIHDAADQAPVTAWLQRFADGADDLILLTGEGLRRLMAAATRAGIDAAVKARLGSVRKITRGPKPARALRELGLKNDIAAEVPTTDGIVAMLQPLDLQGRRVAVQLYPQSPSTLPDFLAARGAIADVIVPYEYASDAEVAKVAATIEEIAAGKVDAIAFTSSPQVRRLLDVAAKGGREAALREGLQKIAVAAVGPVVAAELEKDGVTVDITPEGDAFFMKPLVRAIEARLSSGAS